MNADRSRPAPRTPARLHARHPLDTTATTGHGPRAQVQARPGQARRQRPAVVFSRAPRSPPARVSRDSYVWRAHYCLVAVGAAAPLRRARQPRAGRACTRAAASVLTPQNTDPTVHMSNTHVL
ncbi:hypothetical protein FMEAI12_3090016 [Parafrankia sp. Ea1.12]|nr:hypothetical protein FMEAI12_3090016 [Parafrankia sp. Ea1.12]